MSARTDTDVVEWLDRLVAHRSVAGHENRELIEDVDRFLKGVGFDCGVIPAPKAGSLNLCARVGPTSRSGVVLSAHTDVVPADARAWSSDPFRVVRRGSRLYGRGTTDMKGFIAAVLAAAPAVAARGLTRPLTIALSADEELGVKGVQPMLGVLASEQHKPCFCVVGEPTNMRVAVAHKGKIAMRVTVRGRAAHSSAAPYGVSAIAHATAMVDAIYGYQRLLAEGSEDTRFPVPYASINVGRIDGGVSTNVVADRCVFDVELRALPRDELKLLSTPIFELAAHTEAEMRLRAPEASVEVSIDAQYPGLDSGGDTAALVAQLAESDFGLAVDFGTEAGLYSESLRVPVVICGPGNVEQAHTDDEFIEEGELMRAERFVGRIADWLCSAS